MFLISGSYSRIPTPAAVEGAEGDDRSADIVENEVIAGSKRSGRVSLEAEFMRCLELIVVGRVTDGDVCRFRGLAKFKTPRREHIAGNELNYPQNSRSLLRKVGKECFLIIDG